VTILKSIDSECIFYQCSTFTKDLRLLLVVRELTGMYITGSTSTNSFFGVVQAKKAEKRGKVTSKKSQVPFREKADCSSGGLMKMKSQKS
jgi:hypothetical protein